MATDYKEIITSQNNRIQAILNKIVSPSGTLAITQNGTYDVTEYEYVEANIAGEDVTEEVATYTELLGELETAVNNLTGA